MNIPIVADKTKKVARDYGVLIEDAGVALRGESEKKLYPNDRN